MPEARACSAKLTVDPDPERVGLRVVVDFEVTVIDVAPARASGASAGLASQTETS